MDAAGWLRSLVHRGWQVDRKLASAPATGACCGNTATVAIDHATHQGKSDTEAGVWAPRRGSRRLDEEIEHVRQDIRTDADTVIANTEHRFALFPSDRQADIPPRSGVLRRV